MADAMTVPLLAKSAGIELTRDMLRLGVPAGLRAVARTA